MVDTSYDNFYKLRRMLVMSRNEASREEWDRLPLSLKISTIAGLEGMLNGRRTVLFPSDKPESEVTPW